MVSFVVIGEGRPARAVLDVLASARDVSIEALVLENPADDPLASHAAGQGIKVVGKSVLLQGFDGLIVTAGGWLINANSTFIIPGRVLGFFAGRSLNFHPGLLPEYAGLHTHQWAIRNGEREFGVTVHRMERGIDTGAIVAQKRFEIKEDDTGLTLYSRCLAAGAELFAKIVSQIAQGKALTDVPQDLTRRHLYRHRDALDGRIDWNWSARGVVDFIRAGNYEPFVSPTYVARLDAAEGFAIDVLRAAEEQGPRGEPGAILEISATGPLIACGDSRAVRITRARNGRQAMSSALWQDYAARLPRRRLVGRSAAPR